MSGVLVEGRSVRSGQVRLPLLLLLFTLVYPFTTTDRQTDTHTDRSWMCLRLPWECILLSHDEWMGNGREKIYVCKKKNKPSYM